MCETKDTYVEEGDQTVHFFSMEYLDELLSEWRSLDLPVAIRG